MSLENFLLLSVVLFSIGLYGALTRRNVVVVLMSIELMFNAVNVAAVAVSRYVTPAALRADTTSIADAVVQRVLTGQVFALFVIVVAAAEVALGLAIVIAVYRSRGTVDLTQVNLMKR
ncbi:MAG: NADH-quinone oxidoreductase subunit NuoK [Chloroflexi bacterium]|nr:NADH-quinone oxidoreductase subunit NuoK [Chloroflexota bacterium]MBI4197906.1 NADH-quinone oxidoreductase subunit NuoK [Chloroflexota bacterium]